MKLCLNDMLLAFSNALDIAEKRCFHTTDLHGKRVAYFSLLLGQYFHFKEQDLDNLLGCAILHDNGLTEFYHYNGNVEEDEFLRIQCQAGEENIKYLKFYPKVKKVIQYHHEKANGTGPFQKTSEETPLFAQLIHITDWADIHYDFHTMTKSTYEQMIQDMNHLRNSEFDDSIVDAFIGAISFQTIKESQKDIDKILRQTMNHNVLKFNDADMLSICYLFANIIDSKSPFTKSHSLGVANKILSMCVHYHYDNQRIIHMFFAGAMHDVGKLIIDRDILEKPDRLTQEEFINIKNHAYYTYQILNEMNLGDIVHHAAFHHEKLDGSGYPFGKKAEELDFNDRLVACCDIYQALREKRSYKEPYSHSKAIDIMRDMVNKGQIDGQIVEDMDQVFKEYEA